MSGKGGVGKSSIASLVAQIISERFKTIILDFDICGPSITTAFDVSGTLVKTENGFRPLPVSESLDVLSFGSILKPSDAVIWRGPKKQVFLELFFNSTQDYEYVIIDTPPGISEEHAFLANKGVDVLIATTPQNVALNDTQRCVEFCIDHGLNIIGIVENMAWLRCECCDTMHHPFGNKGGLLLSNEYNLNFLGQLRIEPEWSKMIDTGEFGLRYKELAAYGFFVDLFKKLKICG